MPLYSFQLQDPGGLARVNFRAADMRDAVSRPVMRFPNQHEALRIHGSCAGILLLSSGNRLYACNPCTRRWARLPPLHVDRHIIGFYRTIYGDVDFTFHVLCHDRREPDSAYWIFELGGAGHPPMFTSIGRPGVVEEVGLDLVLANGIAPSYTTPPVYVVFHLCWLPQAARGNNNILMFDTGAQPSFRSIPPPTIQVDGLGAQLLEIDEHLAMTVISPAGLDVWVRCNITDLWSHRYRITLLQVDGGYQLHDARVFAVARNSLAQCPHLLLTDHQTFLSRHTIQESLLLHPSTLPLQDTNVVDGDPPFFQNP